MFARSSPRKQEKHQQINDLKRELSTVRVSAQVQGHNFQKFMSRPDGIAATFDRVGGQSGQQRGSAVDGPAPDRRWSPMTSARRAEVRVGSLTEDRLVLTPNTGSVGAARAVGPDSAGGTPPSVGAARSLAPNSSGACRASPPASPKLSRMRLFCCALSWVTWLRPTRGCPNVFFQLCRLTAKSAC